MSYVYMFRREWIAQNLRLLLLFLLPWQARLLLHPGFLGGGAWEYGTVSVYATELLLWLTAFVALQDIVTFVRTHSRAAIMIALVPMTSLFSILFAQDRIVATIVSVHLTEGVLLIFIIASEIQNIRKIASAFVVGSVVQAMFGIGEVIAGFVPASTLLGMATQDPATPGVSVVAFVGSRLLRAYGTLPHPNILGGYLAVAFVLLLFLFRDANKKKRIILFFTQCIIATGLFFTFSRSAWLGIMITCLWFILFSGKTNRFVHFKMIAPTLVVFVVLGGIFHQAFTTRITSTNRLEERSVDDRMQGYREAFMLLRTHPVIGVGAGNYTVALLNIVPAYVWWQLQPVHSTPLLILVEFGLAGVLLFLSFFFVFNRREKWVKGFLYSETRPLLLCALTPPFFLDHYLWSLYPGVILLGMAFGFVLCQTNE